MLKHFQPEERTVYKSFPKCFGGVPRVLVCDNLKSGVTKASGATGVGKSYIVSALGNQACLKGYRVIYYNLQKLFTSLKISKADGSYLKEVDRIGKQDLLILDDFGLQPLDAKLMLLEIIEDRHGNKSTIISSQLPASKWYDIIGESTIADAILDRLLNVHIK